MTSYICKIQKPDFSKSFSRKKSKLEKAESDKMDKSDKIDKMDKVVCK